MARSFCWSNDSAKKASNVVGWASSDGFNLMAPPRRVGALLPLVFDEPPTAVTFDVVPDLRMPVDGFFGAVDLTAILWVVEALMDAMVSSNCNTTKKSVWNDRPCRSDGDLCL